MHRFVNSYVDEGLVIQAGVEFDPPFVLEREAEHTRIALKAKPYFPHVTAGFQEPDGATGS